MPNMDITNVDVGSVVLENGRFDDDTLTLAAPATAPEGLILARLTAGGGLVPFNASGNDGSQIPRYVLTYSVEFAEAGTKPIRPLMGGSVVKERLIVGVAGEAGENITAAVVDGLKDQSILVRSADQLAQLDNQ